jgi:hypothetical protein
MSKLWTLFQEGGSFNWLLLALFVLTALATLVLAVVLARRKGIGTWVMFVPPLLLVAASWIGFALASSHVNKAILGAPPAVGERILAVGTAEALSLLRFGVAYATLLLGGASLASGVRSLFQLRGRFGLGAALALVAALGVGLVSLVARPFVTAKLGGWLGSGGAIPPLLSVPCWLATASAATCAGAALSSSERDAEREGAAATDAIAAFVAATVATAMVIALAYVADWSTILGAASGGSVDADQRARIFDQGGAEARASLIGNSVLLLPVIASFGAALLARISAVGRGLLRAWPAVLAGLVLFLTGSLLPGMPISAVVDRLGAHAAR